MPIRFFDHDHKDSTADWHGNNAAFTCPVCLKVFIVRVRPGTSSGITKFSEHEADGCEAQECERLAIEVLPIFGKPSASVEPSNGTLDTQRRGRTINPLA